LLQTENISEFYDCVRDIYPTKVVNTTSEALFSTSCDDTLFFNPAIKLFGSCHYVCSRKSSVRYCAANCPGNISRPI